MKVYQIIIIKYIKININPLALLEKLIIKKEILKTNKNCQN